jgi:hypothetical protein
VCVQVGRQLEVQQQLLQGLEAQLKERERAVSGELIELSNHQQQHFKQLQLLHPHDCTASFAEV